ncbi:MAG: S8 family serine peptidase [Solirubrobacteraceae bacterium]|nr:S8 family serine peptidase [Solirubrobacteraceae bacterium]
MSPSRRIAIAAAGAAALALPATASATPAPAAGSVPLAPVLTPGAPTIPLVDAGDRVQWDFIPSDPLFTKGLVLDGGTPTAWHFTKANFPAAWDKAQGRGIRIAVIDSEFDTSNPDLTDKLIVRRNAADGTPEYGSADVKHKRAEAFHGSHVAGLAAAKSDNGVGVTGAGLDASIVAIKVTTVGDPNGTSLGAAAVKDIVEAIDFALTQNVQVISISIGFQRHYPELEAAVNRAIARNVTVVASAGNSQLTAQSGQPNYPAAYGPVIAVAATDKNDAIADFSTQGTFVDIAAPGKDVVSTTDGNEPGALTFEDGPDNRVATSLKSGTSMATPIVSGLVALMKSVRGDLTPAEVDMLLKRTARDLGSAGHDPVYGAGRIDALAAVNAAAAYVRPTPPPPPVQQPVAPPPPPVAVKYPSLVTKKLKASKRWRVTVKVSRGSVPAKVEVSLRTSKRVKSGGKRRYVTLAKKRTVTVNPGKGSQSVTLNLTSQGKSMLRRASKRKGVKSYLRVAPKVKGAKATSRTLSLKR